MIIDTHCHIQMPPLDKDIEGTIKRANKCGVHKMIVVGCDLELSKKAIEIAENHDGIFAAIGLHPQDARKFTDKMWAEFEKMAENQNVVAIGETGLDYFKEYSPREQQIEVYKKHIELALKVDKDKVLIIHNRNADEESLRILQEYKVKKAIFHCYASGVEFARKVWKAGYMTSFTGIITYPKSEELRKVVEECPLECMMVETDCPFLAPQKYRGNTNEPAYVVEVAAEIARIKNKDLKEIEEITTRNAEGFFGI
jgi:TatD DNase family protein